jgi:Relaxase/Mobilisation nuclease domain
VILKIVLGKGGRGLLSYLSQIQKAPIHHPPNDPKIYDHLQLTDPDWYSTRGNKPAAGINQLPNLSFLNVVHNFGPNAADHRIRQGSGEVFLQGYALHHLVGGGAVDADGLRRPGHRPGSTSTEKRGGRKLEKQSAPPTFSNFAGTTPKAIAAEFGALRKLKPNLGKAVAHLILSPGPEDRALSKEEWKRALDLALAEHGAADAPHAAYLHADTEHPHLHCFFSRITPAGQVISDSQSYQKNRSASLKITKELKLTPLPNTPNPQAPGDRQAIANATRRAERSGTPGPEKISVQAVREALGRATTTDDYVRLNQEIGNEIVYLRRGEKQEIYGCKIRRIGSTEWVKMSTLAKDLSWPKIAHRFVDSHVIAPAQQAPTVEAPAPAAPVQAKPNSDQYTRAPASIRPLLRQQEQNRQDRQLRREMAAVPTLNPEPAQPSKRWEVDLSAVDQATRDLGPLTRAMALLGAVAIKYSLAFLRGLIAWLGRLLRRFGFGVREAPQQVAGGLQAVGYEPFTIEAEAHRVNDVDTAAQLVTQVATALDEKNAAWLPRGEGRDAIAAGLMADTGRDPEPVAVVAEAAEKNVLDDMFSVDAAAPAPEVPAAASATPPKTALVQFLEATKAYTLAAESVRVASLKPIMYFDSRPQAQTGHDAAVAEVFELEKALAGWRDDHKVAAALGADPLGLKPQLVAARARATQTTAALQKANREHADFLILFAKTPVPTVPFALQDRHTAAAAALKKAQELLFSRARLNLTVLDGNPLLRQKREQFGSQIRRAETRVAAFLSDPRTQPTAIKDVEDMIRALASEVAIERARLAPRSDADDGQDADEAGQHGFAVPGQR